MVIQKLEFYIYTYLQYDCMELNPICIQIPWYKDQSRLISWEDGKTGYPFVDAAMRQLKKVGNFFKFLDF